MNDFFLYVKLKEALIEKRSVINAQNENNTALSSDLCVVLLWKFFNAIFGI
jgi:hypothetical protein